jgi:hypothetical protein
MDWTKSLLPAPPSTAGNDRMNRVQVRAAARKARRRRLRFEQLEPRTLLTGLPAHVFAQLEGSIAQPGSQRVFDISLVAADFTWAGSTGLVGFHMRPTGSGNLNPARSATQPERW